MKSRFVVLAVGLLSLLSPVASQAETISEQIHFLQEDGRHALRYYTTRSGASSYQLHFWKEQGKQPEKHLDEFLYIYPNQWHWDVLTDTASDLMIFPQGSYALMDWSEFGNKLTIDTQGVYTYTSWDQKKQPDGHYGYWNKPDNFNQFVYTWVMPKNFELISWQANRAGEWVRRYNTLSYYGKDVNDLIFTIRYRLKSTDTFENLKKQLANYQAVIIEQQNQGVRVTLGATILFQPGEARLSKQGRTVLRSVVKALESRKDLSVSVNGYTDNTPIRGELKKRFPTNWELSAARALTVLHFMVGSGYPEKQIEARAYGENKPRASNKTQAGRALNRRIELLIFNTPQGS
jgi:flagellar motor protein MotB